MTEGSKGSGSGGRGYGGADKMLGGVLGRIKQWLAKLMPAKRG